VSIFFRPLPVSWELASGMSRPQLQKKIGAGTYGDVFLAADAAGAQIAVKRLRLPSVAAASAAMQEGFLMQRFQHPNIVQYGQVYMYEEVGEVFVCFTMKYYEEGDLQRLLARHSPAAPVPLAQLLMLGADVARALEYLHDQKLIHCDLKPQNILLSDGGRTASLTDFGIAHNLERSHRSTITGTPMYMAPEQARGRYAEPADLWGLGCVLFDMMAPNLPNRPVLYMEAVITGAAFPACL